ncbi:LOW QUALITY PROTEIN: E3 ubiquitin-protein ligase RNF103-like [Lingula anatina]|uniref:LOW QUALITY PROTEIN: E3 ubiquitin-protein ligase RNF103-like n=1 Tax=Lingula anatina TaxID=7574 RepID=A0A1S3HAX6_LINAN|nr:LOW QUALITY PROTEIN: E3 ubiquitin-protein ligase RNF103-like [Lingula anatina]|eukprot:XP_013383163.1 LOW QUALITY PROTEIN: E3 ubiquitin-protein ligase RNF103-like [Lingula anatina]
MYLKLLLLMIYILILFVLARILEAVSWYETGYLASKILDPMALSVRKLKLLLDQRGVSYAGVVEKRELKDLVDNMGEVTEGELDQACMHDETVQESSEGTNFTCGSHFYEQVEDTKDSVWLVQVVSSDEKPLIAEDDWKLIQTKVSRFGVRTGKFKCSLDRSLCQRKLWMTSRLVMALPHGYRAKDNVILRTYTGSTKVQAVFDWINQILATRIKRIHNWTDFSNDWYSYEDVKKRTEYPVRVVLYSKTVLPPMFFSALSVKFTGRVIFGLVVNSSLKPPNISDRLKLGEKEPLLHILTPERNYTYGSKSGEYYNYKSMELFLRTVVPEVNDLFIFFLFIVNICGMSSVFQNQDTLIRRLWRCLWTVVKYNCFLIFLWLPILAVFQFPWMKSMSEVGLKIIRIVNCTDFAGLLRKDLHFYISHKAIAVVIYLVLGWWQDVCGVKGNVDDQQADTNNNNVPWWAPVRLDNYLFRPSTSLTSPLNSQVDLEEGMEMLIERLAVPSFWLQPVISSDYVKDLPVWRFNGSFNSSGSEEEQTDVDVKQDIAPQSCEKCQLGNLIRHSRDDNVQNVSPHSASYIMDANYKCICGHQQPAQSTPEEKFVVRSNDGDKNNCGVEADTQSNVNNRKSRSPKRNRNGLPPGMLECSDCVICLDSYKIGNVLCGLPCGHSFHEECIMVWLSRDNHCCPVCRWPSYRAKPCRLHLHEE